MVDIATITPGAQQVADLIPRLVPEADGTETGSFSTTTNPTAAAVGRLAANAAAWLLAAVPNLPDSLVVVAKDLAALLTAIRIARPLDADEYTRLREEWTEELAAFRLMVADAQDGTVDGVIPGPEHTFDDILTRAPGAEYPFAVWPSNQWLSPYL